VCVHACMHACTMHHHSSMPWCMAHACMGHVRANHARTRAHAEHPATRPHTHKHTHPRGRPQAKVAVLGASGGIGQPLSMFLKTDPRVGELALYGEAGPPDCSSAAPVCVRVHACVCTCTRL